MLLKWSNPLHSILRRSGASRFVFLCDHASNHVPEELSGLGVEAEELERHIGWDIGAAGVTEVLSEYFDAPAILCGVSRLVIDCNRQLDAPDLIPEASDGTEIPGNLGMSAAARAERIDRWFRPYHDAVEAVLDERVGSVVVSIHSMTPSLRGVDRPWQIALSSYLNRSLADPILAALRVPGDVVVGDNQPYDLDPAVDYSVPFHAMRRELPHVQVEFRQDEVADPDSQRLWAMRFATALQLSIEG